MSRGIKLDKETTEVMKIMRNIGFPNSVIARELHLSVSTVRHHIGRQPDILRANYGEICAHTTGIKSMYDEIMKRRKEECAMTQ